MNLMPRTITLLAGSLLALTLSVSAIAQSTEAKPNDEKQTESKPEAHPGSHPCYSHEGGPSCVLKTYYLTNTSEQRDANEILIAIRNVTDPSVRIFLVASRNAIEVLATPDQQAVVEKIIADLDRPRKIYRLTFTLADSDNGKRVGVQHFSIIVAAGQRTTLKQGSKIPVLTGSTKNPGDTQFQYLDIGMSFDISLNDSPGGLLLKAKVEDSAVGNPSEYGNGTSGPLAQEPIIHQTALEGSSIVTIGKPLTLGSVDVAGSTRHLDIEVVAEPVS
jgi:type II secretory pathway component GspD/PulD (secretin)